MNARELVDFFKQHAVELRVVDGTIKCKAPRGFMTTELLSELRDNKAEVITLLEREGGAIARRPADADCELSFAQRRLWFLDQLEPGNASYILPTAVRLLGILQVPALSRALNEVVRRHDALRTSFVMNNGRPLQEVASNLALPVREFDLSVLPDADREQAAMRILKEDAQLPFDLAHAPLLRVTLIRMSHADHILAVTMHHIVSDGWSMGVLMQEVATSYSAFVSGRPSPLQELAIQYPDFAHWQREWLSGQALSSQLNYWTEQLAGAPALLTLPLDRPRPALQSANGAALAFKVPSRMPAGLARLAELRGCTLFMVLSAAFNILLARYSGQCDICVGTPIANRNRAEIEPLIGFFVNTLVLRTQVDCDEHFTDLLKRVRELTLDAYANQDVPFEQLVEALKPERHVSHAPLFQVMLVLQNAPAANLALPGLTMRAIEAERAVSKFDLTLSLIEQDGMLQGSFEYSTDLFDGSTIERMAGHFVRLLEGIVANPDSAVGDLPMLGKEELSQIVEKWNDTERSYTGPTTLHGLFEAQVQRSPETVALVFEDTSLSYAQLNAQANRLARRLREQGVGADSTVAICMERSLDMVISLFAILKAGGAYVPLDPSYPQERLAYMLGDARPAVLLVQQTSPQIPAQPGSCRTLCIERELSELADYDDSNLAQLACERNLAYVIYTSGSTGKPKGVGIDHKGIVNRLMWMQEAYQLSAEDRVLQKTPFSFDVSVWEFFWPLAVGARLVMAKPRGHQDVDYLSQLIDAQAITTLHFVPPMLDVFLDVDQSRYCRSVRQVMCSGQALPLELQHRFFAQLPRCALHNLYGPTEASVDVTYWACRNDAPTSSVPIGYPIANTQIHILDSRLNPVPVGVAGELHIAGIGLARAYLNRPELTAEKFIPNPFARTGGARMYKTGDLARYLEDGAIEYLGRLDDQVKLRGFRIELGEIEAALLAQPGVREAVVLARDVAGDKRLVAYLTAHQDATIAEPARLREALAQSLPDYMVPSHVMVLDAMPLSPNGKIERKALPEPERTAAGEHSYIAPRTATETALAQIWAEVLKLAQVSVGDNFFALGGHSLLAIQLFHGIRERLHASPPLSSIFSAPTVAALAHVIDKGATSKSLMVPLQTKGADAPLFCIHPIGGQVFFYQNLAQQFADSFPVYGIQSAEIAGLGARADSLDAMAETYCAAIRDAYPEGPYRLLGWSSGGIIALAIASELERHGCEVEYLGLLDSRPIQASRESNDEQMLSFATMQTLAAIRGRAYTLQELRGMESDLHERGLTLSGLFKDGNAGLACAIIGGWIGSQVDRAVLDHIDFQRKTTKNHLALLAGAVPTVSGTTVHACWPKIDPMSIAEKASFLNQIQTTATVSAKSNKVSEINGDHYSILESPQVEQLGGAVLSVIAELAQRKTMAARDGPVECGHAAIAAALP